MLYGRLTNLEPHQRSYKWENSSQKVDSKQRSPKDTLQEVAEKEQSSADDVSEEGERERDYSKHKHCNVRSDRQMFVLEILLCI